MCSQIVTRQHVCLVRDILEHFLCVVIIPLRDTQVTRTCGAQRTPSLSKSSTTEEIRPFHPSESQLHRHGERCMLFLHELQQLGLLFGYNTQDLIYVLSPHRRFRHEQKTLTCQLSEPVSLWETGCPALLAKWLQEVVRPVRSDSRTLYGGHVLRGPGIDVGLKGAGIRRIYEYFDQQLRCEYLQHASMPAKAHGKSGVFDAVQADGKLRQLQHESTVLFRSLIKPPFYMQSPKARHRQRAQRSGFHLSHGDTVGK